ncbi:MAG: hypothetical protein JKY96_09280 [Phycisphaerales bacterium]|nr:hypothetical protein [Phycisphaerales bacterium]
MLLACAQIGALTGVLTCSVIAPVPAVSEVSATIDMLLLSMEDAINRGDAGAYMALVDTGDPIFATEQRAWANGSIEESVEDVMIARVWDAMIEMNGADEAVTMIEIVWHIAEEELDRSYTFEARFVPVGLPEGAWVFAGRAWTARDVGDGVVVYSDDVFDGPRELVIERVPELRSEVESALGVQLDEDISVKVYPDVSSLQASISMAYTDYLSGWNEPGESIKILGRKDLDGERFDTLLAHEIGHAVSFAMGKEMINAPWWVLEGIAEVAAEPFRAGESDTRVQRLVKLRRNDELRDWDLLADFGGEANNHAMFVYLQGWGMVHHITEFYGADKRNAWLGEMGKGETLDQATRNALGISFGSLDNQWRAMLAAQASLEPVIENDE